MSKIKEIIIGTNNEGNYKEISDLLHLNVKKNFPDVMIAGGLPPQNLTYEEDTRSEEEITKDFKEQAGILNPYVDFFYFDVWIPISYKFTCFLF